MKKLSRSKIQRGALSATLSLLVYLASSSAQAQTKTPELVAAEAAYAQAQARADTEAIIDCKPYAGAQLTDCHSRAYSQRFEINGQLIDAENQLRRVRNEEEAKRMAALPVLTGNIPAPDHESAVNPDRLLCQIRANPAPCQAAFDREWLRAKNMAKSGTDENGVRRKPGPGCVPYGPDSQNCDANSEYNIAVKQSEIAEKERVAAFAAFKRAKPAPGCIEASEASYNVLVDSTGRETESRGAYNRVETRYRSILTNTCRLPVTVELNSGGALQTIWPTQKYSVPNSWVWDDPRYDNQ